MIARDRIQHLLASHEGTSLDFKSAQYPHTAGNTEELVKDILAFANTSRKEDAFILIGVKEVKGSRAVVVGLTDHLEDANVQQLINTKTQRPIDFSVATLPVEGKKIDVIRIPPQRRPFYLKHDFGRLKAGIVYFRQGSSTKQANPDDIATMGAEDAVEAPAFEVNFARAQFGLPYDYEPLDRFQLLYRKTLDMACVDVLARKYPTGITDDQILIQNAAANQFREMSSLFCFSFTNISKASVHGTHGTITCPKNTGLFVAPGGRIDPYFGLTHQGKLKSGQGGFEETVHSRSISFAFDKFLPGQTHYLTQQYYFAATSSGSWELPVEIFSNGRTGPWRSSLGIQIDVF